MALKAFFRKAFVAVVERRFLRTLLGVRNPGLVLRQSDMFLSRLAIRLAGRFFTVAPDKIVFTNFSGNYDCNPKYICEELLRRNTPCQKIWVVQAGGLQGSGEKRGRYPGALVLRERYSWDYYKDLFTARVIVDNGTSFASAGYRKRRGQYLVNTFHGSLGIKCLPRNTSIHNWAYNRSARKMAAMIDTMISNSAFEERYYRDTYFAGVPVKRFGHPRNDPLFIHDRCYREGIRKKVFAGLRIGDSSRRVCLYAPTFRDNGDVRPYALPFDELREALARRFGGEWVVLVRFHHRSKKATEGFGLPLGAVPATDYPDIVELMVVADVGITDYSSWICEYIHTGRPGFLYAPDCAAFEKSERAFYDPLDEMPFPLSMTAEGLVDSILGFDSAAYARVSRDFLSRKDCVDDGRASARVVDLIEEQLTVL